MTKIRNEENGRRIYITKKMVSEFGATLGCKGCLLIGQPRSAVPRSPHGWRKILHTRSVSKTT